MTETNLQVHQPPFETEQLLEFDWRKLTALGVSLEDAKTIAQTLVIKKIMLCYWRKLMRVGVPMDDARRIARAIAKYDTVRVLPTQRQQALICQYCPLVCRSNLWRRELLLTAKANAQSNVQSEVNAQSEVNLQSRVNA
jgi:hypothetical protein